MNDENRYMGSLLAKTGMVASAHPLSSLAGIEALRQGGTAMDACLSMAAVTTVVLPHMCGLGGDAFFIYREGSSGRAVALNGSGPGGDGLTIERYGQKGGILPQDGILSVAVPGAPLVYEMAAKRFGRLGLKKCFQVGIDVAREGFPVTPELNRSITANKEKLAKFEASKRTFLEDGGPPKVGSTMVREDLASTLEAFALEGASYMYKGSFYRHFQRTQADMGGTFSGDEFPRFFEEPPAFYAPLSTDYRGYTILQTAPVTPGFIMLEEMNILENFEMGEMDLTGADSLHLMIEAKKLAFADRNAHAGDPAVTGFDVTKFISKEYAEELAASISLTRTDSNRLGGLEGGSDTTSFVAWDGEGNVCSFIHSNAFAFGSGVTVPETGVLLNNRAGRSFALQPGHPNALEPGKRPMHTLNCYMVLKDGEPFITGGTPGGDGQPQWNMQMLSLMLDRGMGPQAASDFPRWTSSPGTDVIGLGAPFIVRMESRFPEGTAKALREKGHTVQMVGAWAGGGGAQIIMKDPLTGVLLGGSDRRLTGVALGY